MKPEANIAWGVYGASVVCVALACGIQEGAVGFLLSLGGGFFIASVVLMVKATSK